jgi:acyl-CoA synthetase (NDP forming)/GNAT superfamily N-acetyltransferase
LEPRPVGIDALATDGAVVHIRALVPADEAAVTELHAQASDRSIYLRFFSLNRTAAQEYARTLVRGAGADLYALGAFSDGVLLGVAVFHRRDEHHAEFALLISDRVQHSGLGTLLLEDLAAAARRAGITQLTGEVLVENSRMLDVLRNIGFPVRTSVSEGVAEVEMDLDVASSVMEAIAVRERSAEVASLRPLLAPRSLAVVGASSRPDSVGHAILRNVLDAGFRGQVYAVNPHRAQILGIAAVASATDLPADVELAVLAVPAAAALDALRECGERGCRAAVVVASGFSEEGSTGRKLQNDLLASARHYGIRLLGPNCLGVLNTDPAVRLNATFARIAPRPGPLAIAAQSGAFGAGVIAAADACGLGVAQFASLGNKADIGGNDLLLAWADDPRVSVIALYLESLGDPRRFVRIARQVARTTPILAVKSGRTEVGRKAGQSHTAAAASSDAAVDALLRGSGVVRVETTAELLNAARVLAAQQVLAGPRIAIVGNSGGPEILATDAAAESGLVVATFGDATRARLNALGINGQNPIDMGAAAQPAAVAAVLDAVHASEDIDAVLTVFTEIAVTDAPSIRAAVATTAARSEKATVAVELGGTATTINVPESNRHIPVFPFAESAARALGIALKYARIREAPPSDPYRAPQDSQAAARQLTLAAITDGPRWLTAPEACRLLDLYGIPRCPQEVVRNASGAARAARKFGYPVVLKLAEAALHKSDVGGVRANIKTEHALRGAIRELTSLPSYGDDAGLLLQPMMASGTELIAGAVHDRQFGPLVMLGAGGVLTEILQDRSLRLAPLSATDADEMIAELRAARLLDGYRGSPAVARAAVRDVLLKVAALVDDVPQIAEMDLNPLICRGDQVIAVDVRIRVAPPPWHPDPLVRQLRAAQVAIP